MKTGVQRTYNYLKGLDSGFRRNGRKAYLQTFYETIKIDDLVKSRKSRHSCESSPPQADRRRPCESREPEIYESGFLFSQETLDSRFRGNDENGAKRTFYEAIKIRVDIVLNERQHISEKEGSRPARR